MLASGDHRPSISPAARREALLACAVYVALLCLAYGNVIFAGKSLVYSDNYDPMDPARPAAEKGRRVPDKVWASRNLAPLANFHDAGATLWQWGPAGPFLRQAVKSREMPFWDPYDGAGIPSMANQTPAYFFPPSFLIVVLGNTALLRNVYFLAIAYSAGLSTYFFLRKHGVLLLGGLVGGAAFMFCGAISQNIGSFMGQTAACIPVALLATRWFLENPTARRIAALAAVYAGISLASFPPILAQVFGIVILYALAWIAFASPGPLGRWRAAARWLAACSIGVGLVAWYYVPAFTLIRSASGAADAYSLAAKEALPLRCLFEFLSPSLTDGAKIFRTLAYRPPFAHSLPYLGATAFLLALLASPREGPRRILGSVACVGAILFALKVFGVPPVQWIQDVPGLRTLHYACYFGIGIDFFLALLAGLGVDSLLRREVGPLRGLLAACSLPIAVLSLKQNVGANGIVDPFPLHQWEHKWKILLLVAICAAILAAASALTRTRVTARESAVSLLALLAVAEGVRNTRFPRQFRQDVWRHPPPYVAELTRAARLTRCFTIATLPADTNSAFGIFSLDSLMTFNPPRIFSLYRRYAGGHDEIFLRDSAALPPEPVLDAADVGFVVLQNDVSWALREVSSRGYAKAFDDGRNVVFRRRTLPRYFFTTDFRVEEPRAALEDLSRTGAPSRQVILEEIPSFPRFPNLDSDPAVTVREFRLNRYSLRFVAPRRGLVACSESDFPGWTVTVNGKPARIVPVNYAFRGVEVPQGAVEIRFRYLPPGLIAGLAVSAVSLLMLGVAAIVANRRARRSAGGVEVDY